MKNILNYLFENNTLSKENAKNIIINIYKEKFNYTQISALATIYNMRSPTIEEIKGFQQALLELCIKINLKEFNAIDIVGTGGEKKHTFNISTISCFIIAGLGEKVIKHSNYSSSSITGASNILEKLGYIFTNNEYKLKKQLEKIGICFLHAPIFHPAIKKVISIRQQMGTKTFFNILGPLLNPSNPTNQVLGVNNLEIAKIYHYLYQKTEKNYIIIHSLDGYDEITLTNNFICYSQKGEKIYSPEELGKKKISLNSIKSGNNLEENVSIFIKILSGKGTLDQNKVVLTNTAFALTLLNKNSFEENYIKANNVLKSGKAKEILKKLLNIK